jgi:hypothetical protein
LVIEYRLRTLAQLKINGVSPLNASGRMALFATIWHYQTQQA